VNAAALRRRLVQWAGLLSAYFSAQSAVQALGLLAGILLIRTMEVRDFALYTLAFSIVSFYTFVTDLGSTASLAHFAREAHRADEPIEPWIDAVLSLRRRIFWLSAPVVAPVFVWMARQQGFGWGAVLPVAAALVATVAFQLRSQVWVLALRLRDRFNASYRAELAGAATRLALVGLLVLTAWVLPWPAVAVAAAGAAVTARLAGRGYRPAVVPDAPDAPDIPDAPDAPTSPGLAARRRGILRFLTPTLPSALYFSIQGPLTVWLAATFGGTRNIAEVGALGRLGLVLGLFNSLVGVVFIPRLAGVIDDHLYRRRFFQYGIFLGVVAAVLLLAAWRFPGLLLWVLGESYAGLDYELLLVVLGAALALLGAYVMSVNFARSWNRWQAPAAFGQMVVQAVLVFTLDLSTTAGVLAFGVWTALAGLTFQVIVVALGFTRPGWVRWS
jgi:O-antigen/teichoic acid export membrane protein